MKSPTYAPRSACSLWQRPLPTCVLVREFWCCCDRDGRRWRLARGPLLTTVAHFLLYWAGWASQRLVKWQKVYRQTQALRLGGLAKSAKGVAFRGPARTSRLAEFAQVVSHWGPAL